MKQYCSKFHTENICVKCLTFNTRGLIHCTKCGMLGNQDPSRTRSGFISAQDQIDFANAELKTLVYKENIHFRGKVTDPNAQLRQRARKHLKSAKKKGYDSIIARYDDEETYRKNITDEGLTREDMLRQDQLALQEGHEVQMPFDERKIRMRHFAWEVVQKGDGGRQTIHTKLHPKFKEAVQAKASAASSSSSSWQQSWWSQSSTTPQWHHDDWWQQKW